MKVQLATLWPRNNCYLLACNNPPGNGGIFVLKHDWFCDIIVEKEVN